MGDRIRARDWSLRNGASLILFYRGHASVPAVGSRCLRKFATSFARPPCRLAFSFRTHVYICIYI